MYLKIQVTLESAQPRATRVIALDPTLTLDRVHAVLQASFGWFNSHLHQFTQRNSSLEDRNFYIYPGWKPEMLAVASFAGPEDEVSIGDVLREPGDFCYYEYDFGDSWVHRLELDGLTESADFPYVIEGAGTTPEEDSRAEQTEQELPAYPISDATLAEINAAIEATTNARVSADVAIAFGGRVGPLFEASWERISYSRDQRLNDLCEAVMEQPVTLLSPNLEQELEQVLKPWTDFLNEAEQEIPLTQAGYIAPKFTAGFVEKWKINAYTTSNREVDIPQMIGFHSVSKKAGLTRKYRSTLRLTRAGKAAKKDAKELVKRLIAANFTLYPDDFYRDAMVLGLMLVATGAAEYSPKLRRDGFEMERSVAELLGTMHWSFNGRAPDYYQVMTATKPLDTILNPLHQNNDFSPKLARYCAWQGLSA